MLPNLSLQHLAVGFCGDMGTGKTTLSREVARRLEGNAICFGDYVRFRAAEQNVVANRGNLQDLGQQLFDESGSTIFVESVLEWAQPETFIHIFDGVRHVDVWLALQKMYVTSSLIFLHLPEDQNEQRLKKASNGGPVDKRHKDHIVESQSLQLQAMADVSIATSPSVEICASQIEKYLRGEVLFRTFIYRATLDSDLLPS